MKRVLRAISFFYPSPCLTLSLAGLSVFELTICGVHSKGIWTNAGIPWHGLGTIVLWSVSSTAVLGWIIYWLTSGLATVARRSSLATTAGVAFLATCSATATALYIVSWIYYWRTSMFLDAEALEFGIRNRAMIWKYLWQAERTAVLLLAATSVCAIIVFGLACRRSFTSRSRCHELAPPVEFLRGLITIAVAVNIGIVATTLYGDPPEGPRQTKLWWQDQRPGRDFELRFRISPLVTLIASPLLRPQDEFEGILELEALGPTRATLYPLKSVEQKRKHSVILIAMEALRSDIIHLERQGREVMPNLNELARTGRLFTRAYAQSSHSNYADPALLSSLYPLRSVRHHYYSRSDPWPKVMLYDVLKKSGYDTALFSSQNETWGYMDAFLESPNLDVFFDSRSYDGPTLIPDEDIGFARYAKGAKVAGKLDDAITMDHAIEWLKERKGRPFNLCMNLQTSHFPYEMPPGKKGPFRPAEFDFEISFAKYPEEKVPVVRNAYFNALHYMDKQLGRLVKYLDKSGLRGETLIVVAGDNGECFYENGHPTHAGPPYEPAVHVALVMNCPTSLPAKEDDYLIQMIDVVPTIIAWLGLPAHPCFQGIDALTHNRPREETRAAFIHCCSALSKEDAIITNSGWKLIFDRGTKTSRLYNLRHDPSETIDLSASLNDIRAAMEELLDEWRHRQLLYYKTPRLHGMYYPPRTPHVMSPLLREVPKSASLATQTD